MKFLPMLCQEYKDAPGQVPTGDEWAMERKQNGWRFVFEGHIDGVRAWAGRNSTDHTGEARAVESVLDPILLPGTVVDCEVVPIGGGTASDVRSLLSAPSLDGLKAVVFDILAINGHDVRAKRWDERREYLEALSKGFDDEFVELATVHEASQEVYDEWVAEGAEGVVVKRRHSFYVAGRSWNWIKVKATQTAEARILGFKPGKGSRAGQAGAFEVELLDGGVRTTVGTSTNEQRDDIEAHPGNYLGHVLELKHYGLSRDGVPIHPTFLRMRPDRDSQPTTAKEHDEDSADQGRAGSGRRDARRHAKAGGGGDQVGAAGANAARRGGRNAVGAGGGKSMKVPHDKARAEGAWLRNYGAMKPEKLARCIAELEAGEGDAVDRVNAKGGSVERNLAAARDAQDKVAV